jgi:hypothetical protein
MNRALRTSAWRNERNDVTTEIVWVDEDAKSKWSVRLTLAPEQAVSFAERLLQAATADASVSGQVASIRRSP